MGVGYNPKIVTDGLLLYVDAANRKSYNIPLQTEHGWSDWYCMVSGTATYSIVDAGVSIYQRTSAGVVTTVVPASAGPTRGTVAVTAGNFYYGDGPINIIVEDGHQCLAPLTIAGTLFWNYATRNPPVTFYVYSPYGNATVNYFDATPSGVNSAATATVTVNKGTSTTYSTNNLNSFWISSDLPIVVTASCVGADKLILHPMSNYVFRRFAQFAVTSINSVPSSSTYAVYDTVNKVMEMNIADGSGLDGNQGLGLEYLSDTYSWGNYLSDYVIVAPYDNTNVSVQYWDAATSAWITQEIHNLTGGTITNPVQIQRDGSAGVGVTATNINGSAANFGTSQLWRWSGNNPFFLAINDTADDEFTLLGWTQASYSFKPREYNIWKDLSGRNNNFTMQGYLPYSSGSITSTASILSYFILNPFAHPTDSITVEMWCQFNVGAINDGIWSYAPNDPFNNDQLLYNPSNITLYGPGSSTAFSGINVADGTWKQLVRTSFRATGEEKLYINGVLVYTVTTAAGTNFTTGGSLVLGQDQDSVGGGLDPTQALEGKYSLFKIYNRVLSDAEVKQNFNAIRARYGL